MLTILPSERQGEATCECGQPAMPNLVMIQHCVNHETGDFVTHGPDRICAACVEDAETDGSLGVIVLHIPDLEFVLVRM
jgi:hypothetical protein